MVRRKRGNTHEQDLEVALEQLRGDLEALQKDVRAVAGEAGGAATDRINQALNGAMSSVEHIATRVEGWGEENLDTVRDAVRAQPLQACMIALGAGALLGALLRG